MATFVGKDGIVKVSTNSVANVRSFEVNEEISILDNTVMGATWETHDTTFKRWTATVTCLWDDTDTNGQEAMTNGASVDLHLLPEGDTTGDNDITGTATIQGRPIRAAHDGHAEVTFNAVGNGALSHTTAA